MFSILFTFLTCIVMNNTDTATAVRIEAKELPYATDALAPAISAETIEYHYGKHYKGYVDKLNELIVDTPFADMPLEDIIMGAEGPIYNNAAQAWNHEFYFSALSPKPQMTKACVSLFGSGWVWLVEEDSGRLSIISESNAGNPMRYNMKPLLCIDVWEHAYYIDYRNRRADAVKAIWPLIDWKTVEQRYRVENK